MSVFVGAALFAGSFVLASAAPAAAAPAVTLTPNGSQPGVTITVAGSGFDPNARVDVFFDTADVATAASNASGAVSISIQISKSAQPGTHWITLDETHANRAAQAAFYVVGSWLQWGYGPSGRGLNPVEDTIDAGNADQLMVAWSRQVTASNAPKPFVVVNGNAYVLDEGGVLHAYSSTGGLLWYAAIAARNPALSPASSGGRIFVVSLYGVVFAYNYLCRTDGGLCSTPLWHTGIGLAPSAGLTVRNGLVYVPGSDGKVHVLNATTGAPGTSITPSFGTGAVTQPVAFTPDGAIYMVQGTTIEVKDTYTDNEQDLTSILSPPAVGNAEAYVTRGDGSVTEFPSGWSTPIGGVACDTAPVLAKGVVYAATCTTLGAFTSVDGAMRWSITLPGPMTGLAIANDVLYACANYRVQVYAASNGAWLGQGGLCVSAPEIAQGAVYSTANKLQVATLDGATYTVARPDPRTLRPTR
jgi:hypothetical protein